MKVLITAHIPGIALQMLRGAGLKVDAWEEDRPMTAAELAAAVKGCDVLLCTSPDRLDAGFLSENAHLKMLSQFAAGYDNIDLDKAKELGMVVANAPGAMTEATADIAFGLLLAVSRKMFHLHKSILRGEWGPFRPQAHLGMELRGKTLGIFGMGRIGIALAERCRGAYGMEVIYHNRSRNSEAEKTLGARRVSFEELLAQSDILSVHAALTAETEGRFDRDAFIKMKPSAIFINTARGGIHQQDHLLAALQEGEIWGAGLDVTNPEPMRADHPLLNLENVAITPHIGSATVAARTEMARLAAENILQFAGGQTVTNRIA